MQYYLDGVSVREWCRKKGVNYNSVQCWKRLGYKNIIECAKHFWEVKKKNYKTTTPRTSCYYCQKRNCDGCPFYKG